MVGCVVYRSVILLAILLVYEVLCYNYINVIIEPSMVWIMVNIFMIWGLFVDMVSVLAQAGS